MIKARAIFFLATGMLAALAVGCGGGDSTAATSVTKPAFIKAADAICEKADETQDAELSAYLKKNPKAESSEAGQIKMIEAAGLPPVEAEIEELVELGAPEGEEEEVEALWANMERALKESEEDPSSVLASAGNPFEAVDKEAAKYGFKACNNAL